LVREVESHMILSMTGFGSALSQRGEVAASVEVRTVNHRFLDLHIRLGREFAFLESEIQQLIRGMLSRGRVDVNVTIQSSRPAELLINSDLARGYAEAARKLREELQMADALDLRTLLTLPGVVQNKDGISAVEGTQSDLKEAVIESLRASLSGVVEMRQREGEALQADMHSHLSSISEKACKARELVPLTIEDYRSRLQDRLEQLLPPKVLDPQRLAQEVAILVERSDVSEEFARLDSHIAQFSGLLQEGKEVGKKLDFLLQEMQREVNTMLSKSGNLEITRLGIALKADIEKLREQVQNVE
jgi:uncharacterized protein (TIGR00255 family)